MLNRFNFALEWYKESQGVNPSPFFQFIGNYICIEILTKGLHITTITEDLEREEIVNILNKTKKSIKFFKKRVIYNMKPNSHIPDSSKDVEILNSDVNEEEKLKALLRICKIIRNNLVHGDKLIRDKDDIKIVKEGAQILSLINNCISEQ